ncbi:MAG: hypothetical protein WCK88_05045 [bacterium]
MTNTQKNTIETIINDVNVSADGKDKVRAFYEHRKELQKEVTIDRQALKDKIE